MIDLVGDDREDLLQRINERAEGRPIPPNFKPLELPPEERPTMLSYYDLPQEPDQDAEPDLHQYWTQLFSEPLRFQHGPLSYAAPPGGPLRAIRAAFSRTRQQSSLNWSGASITPREGRMFVDVLATWKVPSVSVPPGGDPDEEYKSSCWVGLDGQRAYVNSTLPQLGSEQGINKEGEPPGPRASVWVQWWPMDEMTIRSLPVAFGDRVYCWVTAVSFTRVRCIIKVLSETSGRLQRFYVDAPDVTYTPPLIPELQATISGATAEWITEAPTSRRKQQILPLPDYGQVDFRHCYALSARAPGVPEADKRLEPLTAPTLTRMYKIGNNRRVTISTAERPLILPDRKLNAVRTTFVK